MKTTAASAQSAQGIIQWIRPSRSISRILPVLALLVFGTMFVRHIGAMERAEIGGALAGLAVWQWTAALGFTALSFRALGLYDVLVHRVLHTGQPAHAARRAGVKAIALSQTLGFGAMTGGLVRWRCLPELSAAAIARLSATVSLSFLAALAVIAALVVPFSGLVPHSAALIASGVIAIVALVLLARLGFRFGWIPAPVRVTTLLALLAATAADTACAAGALWVLWPETVSFQLLFAAYLVALGAGLLSNAPGGVGAFDLSLLAMMPVADDAAAMAALMAFRIIYYAIPAGLALLSLMRPAPYLPKRDPDHAEAGLARQSAHIFQHPNASLLTLPCWGTGAVLGDLPAPMTLSDLRSYGAPRALYKCSARQAARARTAGWQVMRCAEDAILDVPSWTSDGPKKRQLRRALKTFAASGLEIREVHKTATLTPVAQVWAQGQGGERGHSMGRFCPDYLQTQRVFAAYDGMTPVAFVSFHTGDLWTLDLMRHGPLPDGTPLPAGTMHALVLAGLEAARAEGATTLSLASVPSFADALPFAARSHAKASGLIRFKQSFAPNWHARYSCAPDAVRLALTLGALAYVIHRPPPLPRSNPVQRNDEDYSFAPSAVPREARGTL